MSVNDQNLAKAVGGNIYSRRSDHHCLLAVVLSLIIAFLNIIALVLAFKIPYFKDHMPWFSFKVTSIEFVGFSLLLVIAMILTSFPSTRSTGFGVSLAVGGILTVVWSGLSNYLYFCSYLNANFTAPVSPSASVICIFVIFLCLAIALAATSIAGIFLISSPISPHQSFDPARRYFVLAAVASAVWVGLWCLFPGQSQGRLPQAYAFHSFVPFGIVLNIVGIIGGVSAFTILAIRARRRSLAVGVTVGWFVGTLLLLSTDLTIHFSSTPFSDLNFDWKYELKIPAIIAAGVLGMLGCMKCPETLSLEPVHVTLPNPICAAGHEMPAGDRFCADCGSPAVGAVLLRCPNGHELLIGEYFCSECGSRSLTVSTNQSPPQILRTDRATPVTNGLAIGALVTGILGMSVLAIVFGFVARSQIRKSAGGQVGNVMATVGIILGFAWAALSVLLVVSILALASH